MLRLFQNTHFLRLLFAVFFMVICLIKVNILYAYVAIFYLSFEWLNANQRFRAMPYHTAYNFFIVFFIGYILVVRSGILTHSEQIIFHLNSVEHVLFAIIICLHLSIYLRLFEKIPTRCLPQLLLVLVTFHAIGLLNEYFQNYFRGAPTFVLDPNSLKDLVANAAGTAIYAALAIFDKKTQLVFLVKG